MLDTLDLRALPTPIANAIVALEAASNPHEARDRLVEVFRATLRFLGGLALAARLEVGGGPSEDHDETRRLLERLRRQSLTDGEWVGLTRELLRGWKSDPSAHPLPALVEAFVGRRTKIHTGLDELLGMRKRETVAHGTTGTAREAQAIVDERLPQLVELLAGLEALFVSARVVVPLQRPADEAPQRAWLLHGPTTWRGEWRSVELAAHATPGKPVIVDPQGTVRLVLDPAVICERASPDVPEDLFFFDGRRKRSAAFVAFPSLAEVWREDVLERLGLAVEESDGDEATSKRAPFRGLTSFDRRDAAFFVGREKLVEQLTNRVSSSSWVTVTGASGSGKTSLLAAGVDPALRARVEREGYRQGDDAVYAIVLFRPGDEPLRVLAMELDERLGLTLDRESPSSWARQILDWCAARRRVLVLMVDQAEELVTRCKDVDRREAFGALLAELTASVDLPVRVVFSLRVDFMARVATIRSLGDRYQHVTQVVTTPAREDLVRILVEPAARFGVRWEEGLAEEIARTVEDEDSALPLLSYVASRLWDERGESDVLTREAYEALGGVKGALAAHAEKVVARWTEAQRRVARAMLLRLVTADWTRDVVPRAELEEIGGEATDAILGTLERERLVVARTEAREGDGERQVVELAHESLLEHWHQLREWRDEDVEAELHHARLRGATREWLARGRAVHALWGREKLAEHAAVRARRGDTLVLTADETAFVQASDRAVRRRRRVAIGTTAVVTSVVAAFAVFAVVQWRAAVTSRAESDAARVEAEAAQREAERRALIATGRGLIAQALDHDNEVEAAVMLGAAAELSPEVAEFAAARGAALRGARPMPRVLTTHDRVTSIAYSPDGATVLTGSEDGEVRLWDARTGAARATLRGHTSRVTVATFSSDGVTVLTGSADGSARVWDARTGAERTTFLEHEGEVVAAAYSPDSEVVVTGSMDGTARVWFVEGGARRWLLRAGYGGSPVWSVAFSPDGSSVLTGSGDELHAVANLWDVNTGEERAELRGGRSTVSEVGYSPDGSILLTRSVGEVRLWMTPRPTQGARVVLRHGANAVITLPGHGAGVFSPDGATVCTGSEVWNARTGERLIGLRGHDGAVTATAYSPDGGTLLTGAWDGTARLWDARSGRLRAVLVGHDGAHDVAYGPDGRTVLTNDGTARLWDTRTARNVVRGSTAGDGVVWAVAHSRDATTMLFGLGDGTARLRDTFTGAEHLVFSHGTRVTAVSIAADNSRALTGAHDGTLRLWDTQSAAALVAMPGHDAEVTAAAFAPDGQTVATGSRDRTARLWSVQDGTERAVLRGHTHVLTAVAYSPDGRTVLTGASDATARMWDARTGDALLELRGHRGGVTSVGYSPDGMMVLTGSRDGTARLWDVNTGVARHVLNVVCDAASVCEVRSVAYSPLGTTVLTGLSDGTTRLWDSRTGLELDVIGPESSVIAVGYAQEGTSALTWAVDGTCRHWNLDIPLIPERTNLRVCENHAVIPVAVPLEADAYTQFVQSLWASPADCEGVVDPLHLATGPTL